MLHFFKHCLNRDEDRLDTTFICYMVFNFKNLTVAVGKSSFIPNTYFLNVELVK